MADDIGRRQEDLDGCGVYVNQRLVIKGYEVISFCRDAVLEGGVVSVLGG